MKRLVLLVVIALSLLAAPALAQDVKVGFVDLQKALNLSQSGQAAKEQIKQKVESYDAQVKAKQEELQKLKESLEKQAMLLSEEARGNKEREYQQKVKDYQRYAKDIQEELQQADADFTRKILEQLFEVVQDIGKKEGYTMILEKTESAMLYGDSSIDLTDKVIQAFDQK